MIEKVFTVKAVDEQGNRNVWPLIGDGLEKTAAPDFRANLHPRIREFLRTVTSTPHGIYVLVNALGAGEFWGSNVNGDLFPEKALVHSPPDWDTYTPEKMREVAKTWDYGFPTFMNAYPYKHHVNKDPSKAFGRVELAVWNPVMHRVELIIYLDRELAKQWGAYDVIERIERGEFPDVSMGCKVPEDFCTICEKASKTTDDYCVHAKTMMNKILPDGRKVAVRNDRPRFFDISFVFIGADKTAKVLAKIASVGNQTCAGSVCVLTKVASISCPGSVSAKERMTAEQRAEAARRLRERKNMWDSVPQRNDAGHLDAFKIASARTRAASALIGSGVGFGSGYAGSVAADKIHKQPVDKKEALREGLGEAIGGAVLGGAFPFSFRKVANDAIKKKIDVLGVPVWIEWKKGEVRQYKDKKTGEVKYRRFMKADYGYIPGTKDADGEEIDVYVGPDRQHRTAYVVKQLKKDGSFDEHKVMLGYATKKAAEDSYEYHMGGTKERFGGMTAVSVKSLIALFADNEANAKEHHEKKASKKCPCAKLLTADCCHLKGIDKLAEAVFDGRAPEKRASHRKVSEIIKSIPAGPFTRDALPRLEGVERDIPRDVLDLMGGIGLGPALGTLGRMGIVLKPREFQRVALVSAGDRQMADELDTKGRVFGSTDEVDPLPFQPERADDRLGELLGLLGLLRSRSIAGPALRPRVTIIRITAHLSPKDKGAEREADPLMKKLAAAYNGYRQELIKKASTIENCLTLDPQLRADLYGSSMAEAFAGGVEKVATSALGPESLAYLVGAFQKDRDFTIAPEAVLSLAQMGCQEAAA